MFRSTRSSGYTNQWGIHKPQKIENFNFEVSSDGGGYISCEGRRVCDATMMSDGNGYGYQQSKGYQQSNGYQQMPVPSARDFPKVLNMLNLNLQRYAEYFDQTCDEIFNTMSKHGMQCNAGTGTGTGFVKGADSSGHDQRLYNLEAKMREFQRKFEMESWKGHPSSLRGGPSSGHDLSKMDNKIQDVQKTVELVEYKVQDEQEDLWSEVQNLKKSLNGNYSMNWKKERLEELDKNVQDLQRMFEMMHKQINFDAPMNMDASSFYQQGMQSGNFMQMAVRSRRAGGEDTDSFSNRRTEAMIEDLQRMMEQKGRDEQRYESQIQDVRNMVEMMQKRSRDEQHAFKAEMFKMIQSYYSSSMRDGGYSRYQGNSAGLLASPRGSQFGTDYGRQLWQSDFRGYDWQTTSGMGMQANPHEHRLESVESRIDDLRRMIDLVENKVQVEQKEVRDQGQLLRQFTNTNMLKQLTNTSMDAGSRYSQGSDLSWYEQRLGNIEANFQRFGHIEVNFQDLQRKVEKLDKKINLEHDDLRGEVRKLRDNAKHDTFPSIRQGTRSTSRHGHGHGHGHWYGQNFEGQMQDLQSQMDKMDKRVRYEQDEFKLDIQKLKDWMKNFSGHGNVANFRSSKGNLEYKVQDMQRTVEKDFQQLQRTFEKTERKLQTDHDELKNELKSMKFDSVSGTGQNQGHIQSKVQNLQRMVENIEHKVHIDQNELRNEVQRYFQNMNFEGGSGDWQGWQDQRMGNLEYKIQDMQRMLEMVMRNQGQRYPMTEPNPPSFGSPPFGTKSPSSRNQNDLPMVPGKGFGPPAGDGWGSTSVSGAMKELDSEGYSRFNLENMPGKQPARPPGSPAYNRPLNV